MRTKTITAIIPAYNEEQTVADVVTTLLQAPSIAQVIVISDGSTDTTAVRAREAGAMVYEMPHKEGKGEAMLFALTKTDAAIVGFFDADLRGLTPEHVEQLSGPVLSGARVMNVALRDRGRVLTFMTRHLPLIAGERVMLREVIEGVPVAYLKGFMVEAALNYYCRAHRLLYGAVELKGLSMRRKYEKVGYGLAVLQYIRMFFQVGRAMVRVRLARLFGKF
jgi:glycosyltransferase involved in cell wall biosynthesis